MPVAGSKGVNVAGLLDADADGVDLFTERRRQLRGGHWINVALVVVPVGQQNHDAALAVLDGLEAFGAGGGGVADGGAEVADEADVKAVEVINEPVVVQGERAGQVGHGGKDDEAHAVAGPLADEVLQHLRGDVDSVTPVRAVRPCREPSWTRTNRARA